MKDLINQRKIRKLFLQAAKIAVGSSLGMCIAEKMNLQFATSVGTKKNKKRCWQLSNQMILCTSCRVRLGDRSAGQQKINKKSSWQTQTVLIIYKSCRVRQETQRTLITEQWNNLERFEKMRKSKVGNQLRRTKFIWWDTGVDNRVWRMPNSEMKRSEIERLFRFLRTTFYKQ